MLFDLFKTSEDAQLTEYDKRIMFKMMTVMFSVTLGMEDELKFMTKEDVMNGKIITTPMHEFDSVSLIQALKTSTKIMKLLQVERFNNDLIPTETIQAGIDYYKIYYAHFLELEFRNDSDLKKAYIQWIETLLEKAVSEENYDNAIIFRDKIKILKNTY